MILPLVVTEDGLARRESLSALLFDQVSALLDAGFGWSALPADLRGVFCLTYYKAEVENGGHAQFMRNAAGFHGGAPARILAWAHEAARDLGLTETGAVIAAFQRWISTYPDDLPALADLDIEPPAAITALDRQMYQADRGADAADLAEIRAQAWLQDRQPQLVVGQAEFYSRLRALAQTALGPDAPAIQTRRLRQDLLALLPNAQSGLFLRLMQGTPYETDTIGTVQALPDGGLTAMAHDGLTMFTCTVADGIATLRQTPTERAAAMIEMLSALRRNPVQHLLGLALDRRYRGAMAANRAQRARLLQQVQSPGSLIATLPATAGAELVQRIRDCGLAEALTLICAEHGLTLRHGLRVHLPPKAGCIRAAVPTSDQRWVLLEADGKRMTARLNEAPVLKRDLASLLHMQRDLDTVVD